MTTDPGLEHDPRALNADYTPALVHEVDQRDTISQASYADVDLRDAGALHFTEWTGASGLLPEWRWAQVTYLDVEPAGVSVRRVADEHWDRLPDLVRDHYNHPDDRSPGQHAATNLEGITMAHEAEDGGEIGR
jgi:hypothetical protein